MGSVFEKFQRERDQQTENKAYERIEKVIEMLQEGIDVVCSGNLKGNRSHYRTNKETSADIKVIENKKNKYPLDGFYFI